MWNNIATNFKINCLFGPNNKILKKRYLFTLPWPRAEKIRFNCEFSAAKLFWGNIIKNV